MPHIPIGVRRKGRNPASEHFLVTRRAEASYAGQLRTVAEHIGDIVDRLAPDGVVGDVSELIVALNRYGDLLHPWAESVVGRMIADADRRNRASWLKRSRLISRALKQEIENAPTGMLMRQLLAEQVKKVTSLPRDAAERLFKLTTEGMVSGTRADEIAKMIMGSGEVSLSRATMLARTAVSTTSTKLTEARSRHIGSVGYYWRTSKDARVRSSHKKMEGKFVPWDAPPTIDGFTGHAGEFANCRCFPEPKIEDRI